MTTSTTPAYLTTVSASPTSNSTPGTVPVTDTPVPNCDRADDDDITTIEAALRSGDAHRLGEAFVLPAGQYRYVGANIYDAAGARSMSSAVWVFDGPTPYALSGSARRSAALANGRDLGLNAGDDDGLTVQSCVQNG
jgi:hypothetical protein